MVGKNAIFTFCTIFLISSFIQVSSHCVQTSPCSCIFSNGTEYDFSRLGKQSALNVTSLFGTGQNVTYWFQPCKDVPFTGNNKTTDGCNKPVSLCSWNSTEQGPQNRGSVSESTLEFLPGKWNIPMLVYKHNNYTTKIHLICCSDCSSILEFDSSIPTASFSTTLLLISPDVCKHQKEGISGGSVFFILLLVFAGVYFIGGAIALKFLRGATGWEMLPNHRFWCALGTKIKIGFLFLCSGCQDSYERI